MLGEAQEAELPLLTTNVVGACRETGPWQSALALAPKPDADTAVPPG